MPDKADSRITKGCPRCGAAPGQIEYGRSGSVVYIRCCECAFTLRENDPRYGTSWSGDDFFRIWNSLKNNNT